MPPFCIILGRKPPLIDLLYRLDRSVTALRSLTSDHGSPPHRPQLSYDDAPVMSGSPNPAERTSSPVMVEQEGGGGGEYSTAAPSRHSAESNEASRGSATSSSTYLSA